MESNTEEIIVVKSVRTFKSVFFREECISISLLQQHFSKEAKLLNFNFLVCADTLNIIEPMNQYFHLEFGHTYSIPSGTSISMISNHVDEDTLSSISKARLEYIKINEELQSEYSKFLETHPTRITVERNLPNPRKQTGRVKVLQPTARPVVECPGFEVQEEPEDPNGLWSAWHDYRVFCRFAN